jgi:HEAT repeat protein
LYLGLKKKAFFFKERIKKNLELWISSVILADDDEEIKIPEKFQRLFKTQAARDYAIENLIINKKAFSGTVANNIRQLYEDLGFKKDSLKKLQSNFWFIKAKGIQELAIMDQNDQLIKVYRLTNSKNELVRNEAQTAIIQWSGFNGLRFLDVAAYDISEWQQVQLLVQLKNFTQQDMPKMEKWLSSSNDTVVIFALKLSEVYQQFHVKSKVETCLFHQNEKVRIQAVATLAKIGDDESADKMVQQYQNEKFTNRINILHQIHNIGSDRHIPFLQAELENENDFLKLGAAKAIAELGRIELLQERAVVNPEPYDQIYKHVKAEMAF